MEDRYQILLDLLIEMVDAMAEVLDYHFPGQIDAALKKRGIDEEYMDAANEWADVWENL